jgi:hypothetical protein
MKTQKTFITLGLLLVSMITLSAARADWLDQASKLTFSQPFQIPGRVLPAGTYWFVMADDTGSIHSTVRIFNSDQSKLVATVLAVDADRFEITDNTVITFAERGAMEPEAIVLWFYPECNFGHQFVYPKPMEQELARAKQRTVTVG